MLDDQSHVKNPMIGGDFTHLSKIETSQGGRSIWNLIYKIISWGFQFNSSLQNLFKTVGLRYGLELVN